MPCCSFAAIRTLPRARGTCMAIGLYDELPDELWCDVAPGTHSVSTCRRYLWLSQDYIDDDYLKGCIFLSCRYNRHLPSAIQQSLGDTDPTTQRLQLHFTFSFPLRSPPSSIPSTFSFSPSNSIPKTLCSSSDTVSPAHLMTNPHTNFSTLLELPVNA